MKTATEIRNTFLEFFKQKLHQIVPSAPVVVKNDPSLLFTNAGMNQFKDIFLGLKSPESRRVADTQKCLRVSGKHNDLEEVGHDTYHHTLFEMLGNWSFGDYYKQETIDWAWELLTERYEISPDRLYATVFGGDEGDGLGPDTEAEDMWLQHLPVERVLRCGKKDNFWEMGEVGPSGPCSEIHIDLRSEEERQSVDGATLVNADHPQVVEIWNLVFIQYNRRSDGQLEELPEKHIDTGMGFERLTMALQGKQSTYDTDIFLPTKEFLTQKTGIQYEEASEKEQIAIRVIVDHIRAIVFTIADGQLPSNTGAGYVIRRILRRASRYGFSTLGLKEPFLHEMVPILALQYNDIFPEIGQQHEYIHRIVEQEEKNFLRKLDAGTKMFEDYLLKHPESQTIDASFAFQLYDTYGFPVDLTMVMALESGREVDLKGFEQELQAQKERSRNATSQDTGDWVVVQAASELPVFVGYDTLTFDTQIRQYRTVKTKKKELYQLVLDETPFYAESGGQIGDRGSLTKGGETIKVLDTKKENELIVHLVDKLPKEAEGTWSATVDPHVRKEVMANHTATHLVHAALRSVLGTHVEQKGSLVSNKLLRFDFSHFEKVSEEELKEVEKIVNEKIAENIPLVEYREMDIEQAKEMGAMALFGEKYGDQVRVIVFDPAYSVELCGGTHVQETSEIRLFKFTSESSVAAGVRRIEALTGERAIAYYDEKAALLDRIAVLLKQPKDLEKALNDLLDRNKNLEKTVQQLNGEKIGRLKEEIKAKRIPLKDLHVIREVVAVGSADDLKQLSFDLKKVMDNTLIVLGAVVNEKPLLSVMLTDDLAEAKAYDAGKMIRELAREIKGGGGGQAFFATAGGKDPAGLPQAMAKVEELL